MNQTNVDVLQGESVFIRRGVKLQVSHNPGTTAGLVFLHGGLDNRFNWRSQQEKINWFLRSYLVATGKRCRFLLSPITTMTNPFFSTCPGLGLVTNFSPLPMAKTFTP